jgi:hypothetical protein
MARFGRLKHGNPSGDFNSAPRCGARTRRGTACQCPAIRGRSRCRLHGGRSTGPRTAAGLARIRAANTRHGRWSQESIALDRAIRQFQAQGRSSAASFPPEFHDLIIRRCSEPLEKRYVEALRKTVRERLASKERRRLEAKAQARMRKKCG